jgi:hypothetical protein
MYSFLENVVFIPTCDLCQDHSNESSVETLLPCFKLFTKAFGISQKTIGLTYTISSRLKNNHMLPSTLTSLAMIYCSIFKLHKFHPNNNNKFFLSKKVKQGILILLI